jgi:hypothetical protein
LCWRWKWSKQLLKSFQWNFSFKSHTQECVTPRIGCHYS